MSFVQHLIGDVGYETLRFLSPKHLCALSLICRTSASYVTAALYHHIELVFIIFVEYGMDQEQEDNYADCRRRQALFCEAILGRPELAKLVRKLSWTLNLSHVPVKLPPGPDSDQEQLRWENDLWSMDAKYEDIKPPPTDQVWQTLSLLDGVTSLNLQLHAFYSDPFSRAPTFLFPKAHTIKISGPFNEGFAEAIFSHNPSRIQSLTIEHPRDAGRRYVYYTGWSRSIKGSIPTLKSFTCIKSGYDSSEEPGYDAEVERLAFKELADVVDGARECIEYIRIACEEVDGGCCEYWIEDWETPVTQGHFQEQLLPT